MERVSFTRPIWNISSTRTFAGFRLISLFHVISLYVGALLCLCRSSFFLGLPFVGNSWVKYIWKRHLPNGYEVFDYVSFKCYKDRLSAKMWWAKSRPCASNTIVVNCDYFVVFGLFRDSQWQVLSNKVDFWDICFSWPSVLTLIAGPQHWAPWSLSPINFNVPVSGNRLVWPG